MLSITDWARENEEQVSSHTLRLLTVDDGGIAVARQKSASVLPQHYVSEQRLSQVFNMLGKKGVADLLREKLPRTKRMRSGDLGEILATEYINERTNYRAPITRLRWKDHRDMSMRGDDVIGIGRDDDGSPPHFLKVESKSRASLTNGTVAEAREALDRDDGLPSGHALTFVAERLLELGEEALADAITHAQLKTGIRHNQVEHLMFAFTGNAPGRYLEAGLKAYTGPVPQIAVGLRITKHQAFINGVFEEASNI